jgi:hypothetical protein
MVRSECKLKYPMFQGSCSVRKESTGETKLINTHFQAFSPTLPTLRSKTLNFYPPILTTSSISTTLTSPGSFPMATSIPQQPRSVEYIELVRIVLNSRGVKDVVVPGADFTYVIIAGLIQRLDDT